METTRAVAVPLSSWPCRTLLALLNGDVTSLPRRRCGIPLMITGFILLYAGALAIWFLGTPIAALISADGFAQFGWGFAPFLGIAGLFFLAPIHMVMPRWFQRTAVPAVGILFAAVGVNILTSVWDLDALIFGGWLAVCGTFALFYGIGVITQRWWGHTFQRFYDWACPPVTYI